jgi:hypothetical protein
MAKTAQAAAAPVQARATSPARPARPLPSLLSTAVWGPAILDGATSSKILTDDMGLISSMTSTEFAHGPHAALPDGPAPLPAHNVQTETPAVASWPLRTELPVEDSPVELMLMQRLLARRPDLRRASANAKANDVQQGLGARFFRYLTIPIKPDESSESLDLALEHAGAQARMRAAAANDTNEGRHDGN